MRHKKAMVSMMSAAAVVSVPMIVSADTADFTDISSDHFGYDAINSLASQNIITGFQDGTFQPYNQVTREHVAVMLTKALHLDIPSNIQDILSKYQDVDEDSPYAKEMAAVTDAGIFAGYNNRFMPGQAINRGQIATVLAEAYNLDNDDSAVDVADIDKVGSSHRKHVKALIQNGISKGKMVDGNRYFDAYAPVTRAEFAIMLDKTRKTANAPDDAVSDNDAVTNKMNKLNIEEIEVEAAYNGKDYEAEIEHDSGEPYTSEIEDRVNGEHLIGQKAFDEMYPHVQALDSKIQDNKNKDVLIEQTLDAFDLDSNYDGIEVEIDFHDSDEEFEAEDE